MALKVPYLQVSRVFGSIQRCTLSVVLDISTNFALGYRQKVERNLMDSKLTVFRAEIFKMYLSVFNTDIPRDRSALKVFNGITSTPVLFKNDFYDH